MDFDGISGLESEFTYNGLKLNERSATATNYTRYKITDIGGFDDADVRDAREANPARDGELALPAYYGGRTITFTGKILANNVAQLRQMQHNLRNAFASLQESWLTISNDPSGDNNIEIRVRKSAPIQMRETQAGQYPTRDFLVTLRASDPRFYSSATNSVTRTGAQLATSFSFVNDGNATSDPVIRITGPLVSTSGGASPQFAIANLSSGQALGFSFPVAGMATSTSIAVIDCSTRSVSGSLAYSNVLSNSVFPGVIGNTNTFVVSGLTGTGSVQVIYKNSWI
jgi:hypothetical protein